MAPPPTEPEEYTSSPAAPLPPPWTPPPLPIPEPTEDNTPPVDCITSENCVLMILAAMEANEPRVREIVQAELARDREELKQEILDSIPQQQIFYSIRKR